MISLIYVTCANQDEAQQLARKLLEEKLIGCANILPGMVSIYPWKGEVKTANEVVLLLKTPSHLVRAVLDRTQQLHSYDTPCALEIQVQSGLKDYMDWIESETAQKI